MNDDIWDDADLYEGFDEEATELPKLIICRIRNGPMGLYSQLPGNWSWAAQFVLYKLTY